MANTSSALPSWAAIVASRARVVPLIDTQVPASVGQAIAPQAQVAQPSDNPASASVGQAIAPKAQVAHPTDSPASASEEDEVSERVTQNLSSDTATVGETTTPQAQVMQSINSTQTAFITANWNKPAQSAELLRRYPDYKVPASAFRTEDELAAQEAKLSGRCPDDQVPDDLIYKYRCTVRSLIVHQIARQLVSPDALRQTLCHLRLEDMQCLRHVSTQWREALRVIYEERYSYWKSSATWQVKVTKWNCRGDCHYCQILEPSSVVADAESVRESADTPQLGETAGANIKSVRDGADTPQQE
ncbi:hypothetical protein CLAFUW4_10806 [Fulvia fulva]|uniref:F-box domain-containing protein n=1 Tax=Passalora fulva TaxID=5499 RepID=A0A9Q8PC68_PASFU|nr:uncharacterized protein CLAFUR5_09849 [Fulvia fulva]KAK4619851.1 hypothetical protein CLAFUR4_10811 [Fulvia fulva]KAK4620533.1 hypothetical protein CLAFUR0_10818 [Fulvia fulva]UJO19768.1 hypothetical protein CLAFUR5_09849 [Fulvia fulva]WPV17114.1 hypothetical protein CLAFUW4_10806 [Fulvia fulva]WPV32391.1 hypothetical protein CLAFUW7_10804 [Fulvia fulva]